MNRRLFLLGVPALAAACTLDLKSQPYTKIRRVKRIEGVRDGVTYYGVSVTWYHVDLEGKLTMHGISTGSKTPDFNKMETSIFQTYAELSTEQLELSRAGKSILRTPAKHLGKDAK